MHTLTHAPGMICDIVLFHGILSRALRAARTLTTHHPGCWCRRDTVTGNSEASASRVAAAVPEAALVKINMQIDFDTK